MSIVNGYREALADHQAGVAGRLERECGELDSADHGEPVLNAPGLFDTEAVYREGSAITLGRASAVPVASVVRDECRRQAQVLMDEWRAQAGVTTDTNRWLQITTHWVEGSAHCTMAEFASCLISATCEDFNPFDEDVLSRFKRREYGSAMYGALWTGPGGERIAAEPLCKGVSDHCHFTFDGTWCEMFGPHAVKRLLCILNERGIYWKLTRVDWAFDGVPFSPGWLFEILKAGKVRTRCERKFIRFVDSPFGDDEDPAGTTCYLGKHGQAAMVRCYDKRQAKTGVRLELELADQRAAWCGLKMSVLAVEKWNEIAGESLRSFMDLVDVVEGENRTRASKIGKLLPEWAKLIGWVKVGRLKLRDSVVALADRAVLFQRDLDRMVKRGQRLFSRLRGILPAQELLYLIDSAELKPDDYGLVARMRVVRDFVMEKFGLAPNALRDLICGVSGVT